MEWHNMFLLITVSSDAEGACFEAAPRQRQGAVYPVPSSDVEESSGSYLIKLNISDTAERSFLGNGEWVLRSTDGTELRASYEAAYAFRDLSRVFRYAGGKAYVLTPEVDTEAEDRADGTAGFFFSSTFMKEDNSWQDKSSGLRNIVYRALRGLSRREHAPGKGHVLFMTETKDHLTGNLKAVHDKMLERGMDKDYVISVYARNDVNGGLGVKGLLRLRSMIADQDYIFVDDYAPLFTFLDPPEGSRFIQLWHAAVGFKSVGYSRFGRAGSPHPSWSCHRKYTDVIVPHEDLIDVYREVFGVERAAFRVCGSPRLDGFGDQERIQSACRKLREDYPVLDGKRLILFAPTFRGTGEKDAYYDENRLDLARLYECCGEDTVFGVRMHPFVKKKFSIPKEYSDRILDLSGPSDINDLYYAADILITDYSSDYFEFALLRKPVLFYTYDRDMYQLGRGVHRDIKKTAPGKVCDTMDELVEALKNKDFDTDKTERFADRYESVLGRSAADEVIDQIICGKKAVE